MFIFTFYIRFRSGSFIAIFVTWVVDLKEYHSLIIHRFIVFRAYYFKSIIATGMAAITTSAVETFIEIYH